MYRFLPFQSPVVASLILFMLSAGGSCLPAQDGKAAVDEEQILYGELDAGARLFRFVVTVDREGKAKLKSLDEGGRIFQLDSLVLTDEKMGFQLKASGATYDSVFDKKSKSYLGKWKQRSASLDLAFEKVDEVPDDRAREIWEGELNAGGRKLVLRFRVYDSKAPHPVLLDSPNERLGGFTGKKESDQGQIIYTIPALRGKFTGKLSPDGKSLKGTWNQGVDFPLELKKVSFGEMKENAAAPRRPQTPAAPFPYRSEEVKIRNKADDLQLAGTLTIPAGDKKTACVILISGSGPQDRDETIMDHKPFWVIADYLSRRGTAVLRFDDRGTANSTGDHSTATTADFARDVGAVLDFLRQHPRIDASRIGLCGHSEGGLIAPLVASQRKDVAFIVMLAGPGVNGEKILSNQLRLILKASGAGKEEVEFAAALQDGLLEMSQAKEKPDDEKLKRMVDQLLEKFPGQVNQRDAVLAQSKAGVQNLASPWMRFFMKHEPAPVLSKITCPVLVLNGKKDTQVDPELNLPAIEEAFRRAGKSDYEIVLLDNLNHLFQNCQTGAPDEYHSIEETFDPGTLERISDWIVEKTR